MEVSCVYFVGKKGGLKDRICVACLVVGCVRVIPHYPISHGSWSELVVRRLRFLPDFFLPRVGLSTPYSRQFSSKYSFTLAEHFQFDDYCSTFAAVNENARLARGPNRGLTPSRVNVKPLGPPGGRHLYVLYLRKTHLPLSFPLYRQRKTVGNGVLRVCITL